MKMKIRNCNFFAFQGGQVETRDAFHNAFSCRSRKAFTPSKEGSPWLKPRGSLALLRSRVSPEFVGLSRFWVECRAMSCRVALSGVAEGTTSSHMLRLPPDSVENLLNLTVIWSIWKTLYRMNIIYSVCSVQCISPLFLPQNDIMNKYGCTSLHLCFHFCVHRRSPSQRWWPAAVASCATSVALAARTRKPCSTTWATCWRTAAWGWVRAGLLSLLSTYVSL